MTRKCTCMGQGDVGKSDASNVQLVAAPLVASGTGSLLMAERLTTLLETTDPTESRRSRSKEKKKIPFLYPPPLKHSR